MLNLEKRLLCFFPLMQRRRFKSSLGLHESSATQIWISGSNSFRHTRSALKPLSTGPHLSFIVKKLHNLEWHLPNLSTLPPPSIFNLTMEPLAEAIQSHPHISGFKFQQKTHVINLFADDVILLFTNPTISLPFAHETLNLFSTLSYYIVNFNKSLILDLGINQHACRHLKQLLPYTWAENSIPYLCILLTAKMSLLTETNIKPLLSDIRKTQTRIAKI